MRRWFIIFALGLALGVLTGCRDKGAELYETARLEEQQFNNAHAIQLYREIVEKHPDSSYASQARQRLEELEKLQKK